MSRAQSKEEARQRADVLVAIVNDDELLEMARKAIEDQLVEMRDSRMFAMRNNGLVIKEQDGSPSQIIRFGPEQAMAIGLRAIAKHLANI